MKRRVLKEAPELQAARKLLASAVRGIPTLHAPINRVLAGLGLEVSRKETPAEKIARVRAAVARHDSLRLVSEVPGETRSTARRWVEAAATACLSRIRRRIASKK